LCVFLVATSFDYVMAAWRIREVSRESGGLPYPFVPLLKSVLLLMPLTVLLQGVSLALNSISTIRQR
jgi:TRAP-type mannitol/chloroaromatic compound transport system permease small subunit